MTGYLALLLLIAYVGRDGSYNLCSSIDNNKSTNTSLYWSASLLSLNCSSTEHAVWQSTCLCVALHHYKWCSWLLLAMFNKTCLSQALCTHGRPQAWARGGVLTFPYKCCKVLFVPQMCVKYRYRQLWEMSLASGGCVPGPPLESYPGACCGTSILQTSSLLTPGKHPAGTHVCTDP